MGFGSDLNDDFMVVGLVIMAAKLCLVLAVGPLIIFFLLRLFSLDYKNGHIGPTYYSEMQVKKEEK